MKFFVRDIPFSILPLDVQVQESAHVLVWGHSSAAQIWQYYVSAREGRLQGRVELNFLVSDPEAVFAELTARFVRIDAAGGLVLKGDQALFIHRLGKWDLPKGKMEAGESPDQSALREVEEECGIQARIVGKIGNTWHTYTQAGKDVLKCTHWYLMECTQDQGMTPQVSEGISEVRWMALDEVPGKVLPHTYSSIFEIFSVFQHMQVI